VEGIGVPIRFTTNKFGKNGEASASPFFSVPALKNAESSRIKHLVQ
jgi:hypothetical protein